MKDKIYLAHSADSEKGIPSQEYQSHIYGVLQKCEPKLKRLMKLINPKWQALLEKVVKLTLIYHDIGKLDEQAQNILNLSGEKQEERMINHVQAGISILIRKYEENKQLEYLIAAYVLQAHHIGFIDYNKAFKDVYGLKRELKCTDGIHDRTSCTKYGMEDVSVQKYVEARLDEYLSIHNSLCQIDEPKAKIKNADAISFIKNALAMKMALSVVVDSDHEDTAEHYGERNPQRIRDLKPKEKLVQLDNHIAGLQLKFSNVTDVNVLERLKVRNDFYSCGELPKEKDFFLLDGTVGVGKTFKLMKTGLELAIESEKDTINFVLPYIALIDQSAEEYKKALCLDSDLDINVVHSLYESKSRFYRKYQKGLNAPINILTSANFFNIICTNHVSTIKNLHKIAGSIICIDEYPQIADYEFWPLILRILDELAKNFSCKVIFSSGTAKHFWDMDEINPVIGDGKWANINVTKIVNDALYRRMLSIEERRVKVTQTLDQEWGFEKLADEVAAVEGAGFVVLNTRKKGAGFLSVLAQKTDKPLFFRHGGLSPYDRGVQFEKMKEKLEKGESVILVATPGADIGLDLSFNYGFREASSFDNRSQMGGRISRGFEFQDAFLHLFRLCDTPMNDGEEYKNNPSFAAGTKVFLSQRKLWATLSPEYCTGIAEAEIREMTDRKKDDMEKLKSQWVNMAFSFLEEDAHLIQDVSIPLLVDDKIFEKIKRLEFVPYSEIQEKIITVHGSKKNLDILSQKTILLEDDPNTPLQKGMAGLRLWIGVYDPEMYGVYADPIWNICKLKPLIV